jgi:hypothetical protein
MEVEKLRIVISHALKQKRTSAYCSGAFAPITPQNRRNIETKGDIRVEVSPERYSRVGRTAIRRSMAKDRK